MLRLLLTSFFLLFVINSVHGEVVINEFLASNNEGIPDEDGEFHDWIEFYNHGEEPYNLRDHYLTDDAEELEWQFPEVVIEPGEFLLVFASGKDRKEGELHTNFRISKEGDPVVFTDERGFIIDEVAPLELPTDHSYGRVPDGDGNWYFFEDPTPGKSNENAEAYKEILEEPNFSRRGGMYSKGFDLEISHDKTGVEIYYTLDGSEPTPQDIKYDGKIDIEKRGKEEPGLSTIRTTSRFQDDPFGDVQKATVIRARAFKEDHLQSSISTQSYLVTEEGKDRYTLPVISLSAPSPSLFSADSGIYVKGEDEENPNFDQRGHDWERTSNYEIFDTERDKHLNMQAGTRIHGGWTRYLPQKSLRLYARRIYGTNPMEYQLLPHKNLHEFKRVILRNNGNIHPDDSWAWEQGASVETYFRGGMTQEIFRDMNFETRDYEPAILFINGEYWGLYNIRERFDRFYFTTKYPYQSTISLSTTPKP